MPQLSIKLRLVRDRVRQPPSWTVYRSADAPDRIRVESKVMHPQRLNEFPGGYRDTLTGLRVNLIVNRRRCSATVKHRLPDPIQPAEFCNSIGRRVGNAVNSLRSLLAQIGCARPR